MPASLLAASSQWHHVEGASLRLVTSDMQHTDMQHTGQIRPAALEIRLKPGWKTYWADPGASGIPPTLTATIDGQPARIDIGFPAPRRFDDGYYSWAGYDQPVSLALSVTLPDNAATLSRLELEVFLGICEAICIPVQTVLTLDADMKSDNFEHENMVESAFDALPQKAQPGFSLQLKGSDDMTLLVETDLPEGVVATDLFITSTKMLTLDTPRQDPDDERGLYRVPILAGNISSQQELFYTLITSNGAISGHIDLP